MVDYINGNMGTTWFIVGCIVLAIEVFMFGMSTAVLLFAGLAAVLTGMLLWAGVVSATWTASFAVFTVATVLFTALLWIPFKKLQSKPYQQDDTSSDLIGHQFTLDSDISSTSNGSVRYSGIEWRVELDQKAADVTLNAGERVKVSRVSAGVFQVMPVNA